MRKYILIFLIGVYLAGLTYFLLKLKTPFKDTFIRFLDKDIIYLNDGRVIEGWLWDEENREVAAGKDIRGGLFVVSASEYREVRKNVFLAKLKTIR